MANLDPDEQEILNQWLRELSGSPRDDPSAFGLSPRPKDTTPRRRPPQRSRAPRPNRPQSDLVEAILPYIPIPWSNWPDGDRQSWAEQRAKEWAGEMFNATEAQAWLEIGIGPKEVALAVELRNLGLTPNAAAVEIRGLSAMERVRNGTMSTVRLRELLQKENLIA